MPEIKFNITDTEEKCLNTIMVGIGTWADNAVTERARVAQEEILSDLLKHCNENSIAMATGVDAQITQAFAVGVAHTATTDYDGPSS
tara:strand:- start:77 stop:337 length:261 start_codon:yes stop_codon:yes gene_type:complete